MPLLLHRIRLHVARAFKPQSIGTQSTNTSVLFGLDSKILGTSSVHTLILWDGTAKGLATVQAHYDKAYILGSETTI